ncbi:MAG: hypothetical protein V9H26_12815 [Verrucomicrobiota bacterium]
MELPFVDDHVASQIATPFNTSATDDLDCAWNIHDRLWPVPDDGTASQWTLPATAPHNQYTDSTANSAGPLLLPNPS